LEITAEQGRVPLSGGGPGAFCTTRWSVVLQAGRSEDERAAEALEQLCRAYWYPLYAYVRRRGHTPEDAQDLTQGFFGQLLARRDLAAVSPERGRFRAFLLASMNHWLANEWDRTQAQKRGGREPVLSLDAEPRESRYRLEPADPVTPEALFEQRWAQTLLERVIERLGREYAAVEKGRLFEELRGFLSQRSAGDRTEIAARYGIGLNAVDVAIHRLRKRYRDLLREEIAQTVSGPEQIEEEIRHLIAVVALGSPGV
jgi:RNA polymerase sigma-70 factor (ECF subfamily)